GYSPEAPCCAAREPRSLLCPPADTSCGDGKDRHVGFIVEPDGHTFCPLSVSSPADLPGAPHGRKGHPAGCWPARATRARASHPCRPSPRHESAWEPLHDYENAKVGLDDILGLLIDLHNSHAKAEPAGRLMLNRALSDRITIDDDEQATLEPNKRSPRSSRPRPAHTTKEPCPAITRGKVRTFSIGWS